MRGSWIGALVGCITIFSTQTAIAQPAAAPPSESKWYDALEFSAFVDAYASVNYNFPKPASGNNLYRAFDTTNGFTLSWVGADISYAPDPVGGTLSLRFGPTATIYAGPIDSGSGLEYVKQAFVSWKPVEKLTLDFGKFDTPFGAEVAESQLNFNYTRGALYWLAQPLFHTGLRATVSVTEDLSARAMVVNGWNNSVDNNQGKSYALHLHYEPSKQFAAAIGWIGGPEQSDTATVDCANDETFQPGGGCVAAPGTAAATYTVDRGGANEFKAWKHLIDLVLNVAPTEELSLVFNADYGMDGLRDPANRTGDVDKVKFYGAALGARYAVTNIWAIAARGEYIGDPDGYLTGVEGGALGTGTLTLEAKPTQNLVFRLEQRGDFMLSADEGAGATKDVFPKSVRDSSSSQITTTFGVVVMTN